MTLPESLLADLVDYWTFDAGLEVGTDWLAEVESADGGGPITQIGHVNGANLRLRNSIPHSGAAARDAVGYGKEEVSSEDWLDGESHPYVPAGTWCYNAGGEIDAESPVLATTGDGLTLAMRYCPEGLTYHQQSLSPNWLRFVVYRQVLAQIGALDGETFTPVVACDFDNTACGAGGTVPFRLRHRSTSGVQTTVTVASSSVPGAGSAADNTFGSFPPFDVVLRFARISATEITLEVFIDGEKTGTLATKTTSDFASMTRVGVGAIDWPSEARCWGMLTEAAIWLRGLTDEEIGSIGEDGLGGLPDITDDEEAGPGTDNPIITENGDSALNPDWVVERIDDSVVLATEGPQRHTRRPHRVAPRRYRIHAPASKGEEVSLIRELIHVSKGGSKATRWRHPIDDPPAPRIDALPLYRLVSKSVARTRGGQFGTWELVLEEVP